MFARFCTALGCVLIAVALIGCGSDSDSGGASTDPDVKDAVENVLTEEYDQVPVATFKAKDVLLVEPDLPGFAEVESAPGDGICGFRLVEEAANGARATFENAAEGALVEHLVLIFDGNAEQALDAFVAATGACESGTNGTYTLEYKLTPIENIIAEQVVGVETVSTEGEPAITALTIVAREGEEIISVGAVSTTGSSTPLAARAAKAALKRLRAARAADK